MSNFEATILVEKSSIEEVIFALQKEFKMKFSERGVSSSFGMIIQVSETPDEFINYQSQSENKVCSEIELYYKHIDITYFTVSVDISHCSITVSKYIKETAEIIASGISYITKKRVLLNICSLDSISTNVLFEKGKESVMVERNGADSETVE